MATTITSVKIPEHVFPHTEVNINDNTIRTYKNTSNEYCTSLCVFRSPKGKDGIQKITGGYDEFLEEYGAGSVTEYGQALLNAGTLAATNATTLYCLRLTDEKAKIANLHVYIRYRVIQPDVDKGEKLGKMEAYFVSRSDKKLMHEDIITTTFGNNGIRYSSINDRTYAQELRNGTFYVTKMSFAKVTANAGDAADVNTKYYVKNVENKYTEINETNTAYIVEEPLVGGTGISKWDSGCTYYTLAGNVKKLVDTTKVAAPAEGQVYYRMVWSDDVKNGNTDVYTMNGDDYEPVIVSGDGENVVAYPDIKTQYYAVDANKTEENATYKHVSIDDTKYFTPGQREGEGAIIYTFKADIEYYVEDKREESKSEREFTYPLPVALTSTDPDQEGWNELWLFSVYAQGKGDYGNGISIALSPNNRLIKSTNKMSYIFDIYLNGELKESAAISFFEDAIIRRKSAYVENIINGTDGSDGSNLLKIEYNNGAVEYLFNTYKQYVNPNTTLSADQFDPIIGTSVDMIYGKTTIKYLTEYNSMNDLAEYLEYNPSGLVNADGYKATTAIANANEAATGIEGYSIIANTEKFVQYEAGTILNKGTVIYDENYRAIKLVETIIVSDDDVYFYKVAESAIPTFLDDEVMIDAEGKLIESNDETFRNGINLQSLNGINLESGDDAGFAVNENNTRSDVYANEEKRLLNIFRGYKIVDRELGKRITVYPYDGILSTSRVPIDFILDANFTYNVKIALADYCQIRKNDFVLYLDSGVSDNLTTKASSYITTVDIDEATNYWNVAIDSYYGRIKDPYNNRIIEVTSTYNLARKLPLHWASYGGKHIPYAGSLYGVIDSYLPNSVYPLMDKDIDYMHMDNCIAEHINYAQINSKGDVIRGTQSTRYPYLGDANTLSNLTELNNVHIVFDIKKDCEKLLENFAYNFNENEDVMRFNRQAEIITSKYSSAQVKSITASFERSAEEAEYGILHLYISVVHKNLVKIAIVDIDVNRNTGD